MRVRSVVHKFLILCCALYLSGAQWMILQTTAWTGMIVTRSMKGSFSDALESTLDGQHPCEMCVAIASAKQSEERSRKEFDLLKKAVELKFTGQVLVEAPERQGSGVQVAWRERVRFYPVWEEAPPTPPPMA